MGVIFCNARIGVMRLLLSGYIGLLYYSTIICRSVIDDEKHDRIHLKPFWSYDRPELFVENVINVVMLVPVGFMLGCTSRNIKWWQALLIGTGISVSIETLQFVTGNGFTETDDVMHNTLGCMIGYGMYAVARYGYERISKRSVL